VPVRGFFQLPPGFWVNVRGFAMLKLALQPSEDMLRWPQRHVFGFDLRDAPLVVLNDSDALL
jgi:hypothetical protein